jgi:hypothetical protein
MALCAAWLGWAAFEVIFIGPSLLILAWHFSQIAALMLKFAPGVRID